MSDPTRRAVRETPMPADDGVADFKFGADVAGVFDDMVVRSVPLYAEIQRMMMLALDPSVPRDAAFVGIDSSADMLAKCREKLAQHGFARPYELQCLDLNQGVHVENASLALLVLTLQFIRPLNRERLMADVFRGLRQNGAAILVEKVLGEDSHFNRLFIKYYYEMKRRNGYSDTEIVQKREALENVLVPYKLLENRELLLRSGFRYVDVFFKWYNFCGIVAIK
jgi:tRNA (cmo5U34)-methyltransferase